ncbi:MAG: cyclic-phosphate processing receiver domain-containing protein [Myxococcota bacterium]
MTSSLKVFLDDERPPPEGWVGARWPDEVIKLLCTKQVAQLSLDHDLGDDERGTGYDVLLWIEEAVATRGFKPPIITIHSANSSAKRKMEAAVAAIGRLYEQSSKN